MYQAIYEPSLAALSNENLQFVTAELRKRNFALESVSGGEAVYRDGDRFIVISVEDQMVSARLGVGSWDAERDCFNSMRLDEMIGFLYGSLKRGCHALDGKSLEDCLIEALKDIVEFASEFLKGDFRPFLRVLSMKKREDLKQQVRAANEFYLA